jgi:3-oxoacyl-(acyl-carrier-protein) synthase
VTAATFLEQGRLEYAIVIGVDLLSALTLEGFQSLLLYDSLGCRPFDLDRNGLNLGEGCAILILARQKSAAPSFLLTSGVSFNDNTHLTASLLDGRIVANVLSDALKRADIAPSEVVAIKAHGTGTRDNDLAEGRGIAKLFGDDVPPFSSLKAYCGHTLGAAGVLETVAWLACLARGFIPPSKGFQKLDPEIGISPAVKSQVARSGYYLFQFFGFGGSCCAFTIKFDSKGTS